MEALRIFTLSYFVLCLVLIKDTQGAGLEDFFTGVKDGEVDLVILMDRSLTVERHSFYTQQKALIHDVIMYHLPVHQERLRIAIVTFAADADVIVDGISQGKSPVTKCDILNDEDNKHWDRVQYKVKYDLKDGVYTEDYSMIVDAKVDDAFLVADEILTSGRLERPSSRQYVLLATGAGWTAQHDPRDARNKLLADGVNIYVIGTGPGIGSRFDRLQELQTSVNRDNVQEDAVWRQYVWDQPKLIEVLENADWIGIAVNNRCFAEGGNRYCETITAITSCTIHPIFGCDPNQCQNGGTCYTGDVAFQCVCPPGFFGRYCEIDLDECTPPDVCYPESQCLDRINSFECVCTGCNDTYCDCISPPHTELDDGTENDDEDDDDDLIWLYVLIPILLLLLIGLLVCLFIFCRKRRQNKETLPPTIGQESQRGADNYYEGMAASKKPDGISPAAGKLDKEDDDSDDDDDMYDKV